MAWPGGEKYLHRQQNFIKLEVTTTISQPEHSTESIFRPFISSGPKYYLIVSIHETHFDTWIILNHASILHISRLNFYAPMMHEI